MMVSLVALFFLRLLLLLRNSLIISPLTLLLLLLPQPQADFFRVGVATGLLPFFFRGEVLVHWSPRPPLSHPVEANMKDVGVVCENRVTVDEQQVILPLSKVMGGGGHTHTQTHTHYFPPYFFIIVTM